MVDQVLQESLGSLSLAERVDVIDFLQRSIVPDSPHLTDAEKDRIRRRDAEMDADPSIALTWEELDSRLRPAWG